MGNTRAGAIVDGIEFKGYTAPPLSLDTDGNGCSDGMEIASVNADHTVKLARHAVGGEELQLLSLLDIVASRTAINPAPATLRNNLACGVGSDRIQPRAGSGRGGAAGVGEIRNQEWYSREAADRSVR